MTADEVVEVVRYLAAVYRVEVDERDYAVWTPVLSPMRAMAVQQAARELVTSGREHMPRPGQVLEVARRIGNRLALQEADSAWKAEQRALPLPGAGFDVRETIAELRQRLAAAPSVELRFAPDRRTPSDDGFRLPPPCGLADHSKCGGGPVHRRDAGRRGAKKGKQS